jgi:hypothetical protein
MLKQLMVLLFLLATGEHYGGDATHERGLPNKGEVHGRRAEAESLQIPLQAEAVGMRPAAGVVCLEAGFTWPTADGAGGGHRKPFRGDDAVDGGG